MNSLLQSHIHPALSLQQSPAGIKGAALPKSTTEENTSSVLQNNHCPTSQQCNSQFRHQNPAAADLHFGLPTSLPLGSPQEMRYGAAHRWHSCPDAAAKRWLPFPSEAQVS